MDKQTADRMTELTSAFYDAVASSFSATRQAPWTGWERALSTLDLPSDRSLAVLDVACGNLRFERFLASRGLATRAWCVDSCPQMQGDPSAPHAFDLQFIQQDLAAHLTSEQDFATWGIPPVDLAVSFGFAHHLPLERQRAHLVRSLVASLAPGGHALLSFWQLENDPHLLAKAQASTRRASEAFELCGLGAHDYLLGWQERTDVFRYCHHFPEEEVDELVASVAPDACEVARFSADGKGSNLNRYVVLRRPLPSSPGPDIAGI